MLWICEEPEMMEPWYSTEDPIYFNSQLIFTLEKYKFL